MQPKTIQIHDNLMFALDGGGHGRDCHILETFEAAMDQLERWRETYTLDRDDAIIQLVEHFKKESASEEIIRRLERIVEQLMKIPTLSCRGMPDLDFHMLHVLELRTVLWAAYEVGRASVR